MTIKLYVDGIEYTPGEERKPEAVAVEMWYDRRRREWVLYTVDENGYQVGDTRYAFTKTEANDLKKEMEKEL